MIVISQPNHISSVTGESMAKQTFTPKLVLLDFSDISCVLDVAKEVLDCYGCVDILINNASMKVKGPAHKISLELDKKIMDANYFGPITLTKVLLPSMISRRTGQIVLVNKIQGKFGIPFRTAYFLMEIISDTTELLPLPQVLRQVLAVTGLPCVPEENDVWGEMQALQAKSEFEGTLLRVPKPAIWNPTQYRRE
ncbi:Dehydrogenase/reductase SDR family member 7C [Manis javanica]|nr:Dehydrogenase/reductase SDR family member 7C [Manis javanica]